MTDGNGGLICPFSDKAMLVHRLFDGQSGKLTYFRFKVCGDLFEV